jgi:cytochrome o ubiquinol oxidase subunit 2
LHKREDFPGKITERFVTIKIIERKDKYVAALVVILGLLGAAVWYFHTHTVAVLEPSGTVGHKERNLIIFAALLAVLVVVPVYAMTIAIALKYRESNPKHKAKYSPDWDHDRRLEFTWWAIPGAIIFILSIITWNSSHALDPFKPLASAKPPLDIQVVSLDWKWLFIYPKQGIASVNYLKVPMDVPLNFEVTSDSVMNSFWIPALGSQIYAMPGMDTEVHLMASKPGTFYGSSANISGAGFAGMHFATQAVSRAQFDSWVKNLQGSPRQLSQPAYDNLASPSLSNPATYYSNVKPNLYDDIVLKYLPPSDRAAVDLHVHGGSI